MIARALAAAVASALAAIVFWMLAADAARKRRLALGTLPPALPLIVGSAAAGAYAIGAQPAALAALAGVAVAGLADARTGAIFDPLTAGVLLAAGLLAIVQGSIVAGLIGFAGVGTALLFLHAVTAGRGLGLGDVKLGAVLGMALGPAAGFTAIGAAFVLGAGYGAWLLARKRAHAGTPIRFAPFIAAGTFAAILAPIAVPA